MTIIRPLGEALLVKKKVLKGNKSPNAKAKGDLFCQYHVIARNGAFGAMTKQSPIELEIASSQRTLLAMTGNS
jgi:hypothetical protein